MSVQLPPDLQIEILVRLPVKSLLRFKRVSKSFKSLISSAGFISTHTNHHESTNNYAHLITGRFNQSENNEVKEEFRCFQFNDSFREFQKLEFPSQVPRYICYVDALECRGLILLIHPFQFDGYCFESLILWNPAVRMNLTLPTPCNGVVFYSPARGYSVHGFGFDPKSDDYKVLRIMYEYGRDRFSPQVKLFKLSTGVWKTVSFLDNFDYFIGGTDVFQAFVNGASHWLGQHYSKKELVIVLFHMFDEEFRVMKLPDVVATRYVTSFLEVSGGLLSLIYYDDDASPGNESCCIWLMKDYGVIESWTKQYTLDLRDCMGLIRSFRNILLLTKIKINRDRYIKEQLELELALYDLKTNRFINSGIRSMDCRLSMNVYIENLVLLNQVNAMPDQYETSWRERMRLTKWPEKDVLLI